MTNTSSVFDEQVGISFNDDSTVSTDNQRYIRNGLCDWTIIERTGGNATTTFTGVIDLPQMRGQTYAEYISDDINQALTSNSPAQVIVMNIFGAHADIVGATAGKVVYQVELRYKTKFFASALVVNS